MTPDTLEGLLRAIARTIVEHADELTALDQAIGDGDHGLNMKRGFEHVAGQAAALSQRPLAEAVTEAGKTLVVTVGGASGPLYGTFFMTFGKALPEQPALPDLAEAFDAAVAAVERRGKSTPGQKTLLDVLVPVQQQLRVPGEQLLARIKQTALHAADATTPMRAIRGRASFLGERSIGHMDPGARSCALVIATLCDFLEG